MWSLGINMFPLPIHMHVWVCTYVNMTEQSCYKQWMKNEVCFVSDCKQYVELNWLFWAIILAQKQQVYQVLQPGGGGLFT